MQYLPVGIIIALNVYQCTISQLIKMNREERRRIQYQIDANETHNKRLIKWTNELDPKNTIESNAARDVLGQLDIERCVYWKGSDITINEAKELVQRKNNDYDSLLAVSPFDRMMAIVFE